MIISNNCTVPGELSSFDKVPQGGIFKLETGKTYYMKVCMRHEKMPDGGKVYKMMELATGDVFAPSKSDCEICDAAITLIDWID